QLTAEHIDRLGIVQGKLVRATQIPVLYAPAKVLIPPNNEYVVSASQAGIINQLNAALGDEVKKGDVLAQIDSPNLLSLQSNYLKANSVLQLASSAYQRDKTLAKDGIIANRRVQETQSQFNAASLDVQEAKHLLEISGGSTSGQLNSHLSIRSPISGLVIERMVMAGTRIDNTQPLYRIADLHTLWLEIAIPQERITDVKVGDLVEIENTSFKAEISLLGQSVNPENQTILARAVVKNAQKQIRAGQKLNVQINQVSKQNIFKVPNTAIAQDDSKAFVFIRSQVGFDAKPVTIVGKQDEESIISGEFTGEEIVALKGAAVLKANLLGVGSAEQ
ncbi:MAG: efflux RND transporter periplasmic adaptor subunit, partial [Methylococcales bacterium]|nr:efflux RND transporter periplasmic adaptor subunit [Methylococcales bacterium]